MAAADRRHPGRRRDGDKDQFPVQRIARPQQHAREQDAEAEVHGVLERSLSPVVRALSARARQVAVTAVPLRSALWWRSE